jgi:SNF2 family DNA or RNA helicase
MDELARKIHSHAYRAKDTECVGLPELIVQDIPVYFGNESKKVYNQMATEMMAELSETEVVTASMAAVKVMKVQQITGGFLMTADEYVDEKGIARKSKVTYPVGTEKLDVCMDLIDRYVEDHQLIIGCRFRWEVAQISLRLDNAGIRHAIIQGGVSGEERTRIKREYQEDPGLKVIIFQISSATAMTLNAGDIGILYSATQKWDDYWQWIKRLHREGQTKPVYILRLVVKGSIDRQVIANIHEKKNFTDFLVDRQSMKHMLKLID